MKILITGAGGQLGRSLVAELQKESWEIHLPAFDVADFKKTEAIMSRIKPDIVIHLAAKTDVDWCEMNPRETFTVNTKATSHIAICCKKIGAALFFLSTGAIFSGNKRTTYKETDHTGPINVYGRSKLEGENAVRKLPKYCIIRTGWLIGKTLRGKKFVSLILNQLKKGKRLIHAVDDVYGSPTLTRDLSKAIILLIKKNARGIYHVVNRGIASRYQIAKEIVKILQLTDVTVKPVPFGYLKEKALRPKMEALNPDRAFKIFHFTLPHWKRSLTVFLRSTLL